jgi:hypothetical protein
LNLASQLLFKRHVFLDNSNGNVQRDIKSESGLKKFANVNSLFAGHSNFLNVDYGSRSLKTVTMLLFVSFTLLSAPTFIDRFGAFALPEGGGHQGFGSLPSPGDLPSLGGLPSPGEGGASHLNPVSGVHPDSVKPSKINPNNIPSGNEHNINPNNLHPNNAQSVEHCTGFGVSINPCGSNEIHHDNANQAGQHCTGYGVGANPCNKHVDPCLINPCPINPCVISPCPTPHGNVVVGTKSTVNSYSSSPIIVSEEQSTSTITNNANNNQEQKSSSASIPIADAGSDKKVHSLNHVTLDGSKSYDPDGKKIAYSWLQLAGGPIVSLSDDNTVKPTFGAPQVTESTTLTFQLIVDNNNAVSNPSYVTITVEP